MRRGKVRLPDVVREKAVELMKNGKTARAARAILVSEGHTMLESQDDLEIVKAYLETVSRG